MDSHQLIEAQFDRAVEIVQSLPKNGPIQTNYEEKLTMYRYVPGRFRLRCIHLVDSPLSFVSLYKQGTYTNHTSQAQTQY